MKSIFALFLFIITSNCSGPQQKLSPQSQYLGEVFEIIEKHSIKKDSIDFEKLKNNAFRKLEYTSSIKDCYPIVQSILTELGDNHSFFMPKGEVIKWHNTSKNEHRKALNAFSGKIIAENIGYIHLRGFSSGDSISIQQYADSLQNKINSIDRENLRGWILDLRENTGGNCWPMLTGLGPLLGNGICGYFINNEGQKSSLFYKDGKAGIDDYTIVETRNKPYNLINESNPIAILTGNRTASSGELVVTTFHNKPNTRSFGGKTAGFSTGNANFKLSDGSMILLTTSFFADRQENILGQEISPSEEISFNYESIGQLNDPVIKKAMDWINAKKTGTQ